MQLYRSYKDNDAADPWDVENLWCFDIQLDFAQWLFGAARYPDYSGVVWALFIGPMVFNYYRKH